MNTFRAIQIRKKNMFMAERNIFLEYMACMIFDCPVIINHKYCKINSVNRFVQKIKFIHVKKTSEIPQLFTYSLILYLNLQRSLRATFYGSFEQIVAPLLITS